MDRTMRRRIFDVAMFVLVALVSARTAWWLLHEVPVAPGLAVIVVAVVAAVALRGYGHLQLAISTGSNLTLEWVLLAALMP